MLKKKLGAGAIERKWIDCIGTIRNYFKIPSTLVIPGNVKNIEDWAFFCCERLKEVIIPGSVKRIGVEAFRGCTNAEITIEMRLNDILRYISPNAFLGCKIIKYYVEEEVGN